MHYMRYGRGSRVLLAFHGFGQNQSYFVPLAERLGHEYTVYAFDLFYHGKSYWYKNGQALTKDFWQMLILEVLTRHQIQRFSLMGFSMGGKFVLATLAAFAEKVEEVIFIAPDGIKTSTWYSLATYPGVLRNVFRSFIVRPQGFQRLVNVMHKYGIVDKGILKFANTQMRTTRQRRRVYYSWTVFKPLKFPMKRIAHLLNAYQIPVQMYLGKYDKIMTEENMRHLLDRLDQQELHVLETGHNHLIEETAKALAASQPEVGR